MKKNGYQNRKSVKRKKNTEHEDMHTRETVAILQRNISVSLTVLETLFTRLNHSLEKKNI